MKDKNALITGSTSGIGLGMARALAGAGVNLMLNGFGDSDEIEGQRTTLEREFGITAKYNGADISKSEQIRDLIDATVSELGSIDILVNNAGVQYTSSVEAFPGEQWDKIIAINLSAAFHGIKYALPYMRKKAWGRVINTASAHGLVASPEKAAYVAAKHGVVGLTKVVGLETAGSGITCNAICPGWVLTPLVQKQIDVIAKKEAISNDEATKRLLKPKQPSMQFVTADQIGATLLYLCSEAADQVTGTTLSIDGGWTAC